MTSRWIELTVGIFMLFGMLALGWMSVRLGRMELVGARNYYPVEAVFSDVGSLREGAAVVIAGVEIGRVQHIRLDPEEYEAHVVMLIRDDVKLQTDAMASIKTKGLVGEKFIEISPGADEALIQPGGRIEETEPAVDLEELISKYVFGKL